MNDQKSLSRRAFLKRAAGISIGAISARGIYGLLDTAAAFERPALATPAVRPREQYLVDGVATVIDNGVKVLLPPLYHEIITAKLAFAPDPAALFRAQARLERALHLVEAPYAPTPSGLTLVVGWGLPYFRKHLAPALVDRFMPLDLKYSAATGQRQPVLLDAIRFPGDRDEMLVEQNAVMFLLRSDSQSIIAGAERALFEDQKSPAYVGDMFALTSVRKGFVGRGFGSRSVAKQLAMAADIPGAAQIPDNAQLMMGFTSTQHGALAPSNLVNFETLPGLTDQWPNGYFVGGCTMHLSQLFTDLAQWYGRFTPAERVARMFSPRTIAEPGVVTIPNDERHRSKLNDIFSDVSTHQVLGHNATIQQANRLSVNTPDNYGRTWPAGTPISLRDDFNTLDNPFAWSSNVDLDQYSERPAAGLHFVSFMATSQQFHTMRLAMAGVMPNGTNLRDAPYNISDASNGINQVVRAMHRQNYLIPPRGRRSFPLAELQDGIERLFVPLANGS